MKNYVKSSKLLVVIAWITMFVVLMGGAGWLEILIYRKIVGVKTGIILLAAWSIGGGYLFSIIHGWKEELQVKKQVRTRD